MKALAFYSFLMVRRLFPAVVLLVGCRSARISETPLVFFPAPPAEPRIQFLTWASGAEEVEPQRDGFESFILGEELRGGRRINKPYGIAVRDGVAYVADTKGLCLCRLDFKNGTYGKIGVRGPGRLRKPINVAIDSLGFKFVVDAERKQVVVFDPQDQYTTAFDIPEPSRPVDLAIYKNELFVLDNDDSPEILVLDRSTGKIRRRFGAAGGEPGQFKIPNSLCVDQSGFLYVSDTHNWRIQKLTRNGEPVWVKGTPGYQLGQFGRPRGIRVDPDGIIYLVDGATEIVQMFDADGQTLMRFGGPGDAPGALGLPSMLAIDRTSIPYFRKYVHEKFTVKQILFVVSQYGRRLINVYAMGAFPKGFKLTESELGTIPALPVEEGIGPVDGNDTDKEPTSQKPANPHARDQ